MTVYGHVYDHGFYEVSRRSAGRVIRGLSAEVALESVLDVGCGHRIRGRADAPEFGRCALIRQLPRPLLSGWSARNVHWSERGSE